MLSYVDIAIKLTIGFICLIIIINLSGKGQLAPLSAMDQVGNYVLGGIIGGVIYNPDITVLQFVIVLLIWGLLIFVTQFIKNHNAEAKRMIDGEPIQIMRNGELLTDNFKRINLTAHDFSTLLRMQNVHKISELSDAQFEPNGHLTLVKKGEKLLSLMIIEDGQVNQNNLENIGKDEQWLEQQLREKGVEDISKVFCAELSGDHLNIYLY